MPAELTHTYAELRSGYMGVDVAVAEPTAVAVVAWAVAIWTADRQADAWASGMRVRGSRVDKWRA
jgi:hypothetical protein